MRYQEIAPNAAVARFVRCYWILEDLDADSGIQRIVPDGRAELILNLGQPYECLTESVWRPQPRRFFFGQITGPLVLRPTGPVRMMGVRFHPHTAGQLLGVPMCELTDACVPLDDISGRLFMEFDEIEESRSLRDRFAALDRILPGLAKRAGPEDRLVSTAVSELAAGGSMGVGKVADRAGLSVRQFERRFRTAVGIPPKLFGRMQRFRRVFRALEGAEARWADAAVRSGYFDQAHLIRDFREFAGKPPAALLGEDTDLARHFVQSERMSRLSKTHAGHPR